MKPKYANLALWTFGFYLIFSEFREIALDGLEEYLNSWTNLNSIMLLLSSLVAFSLYSIGAYTIFLYTQDKKRFLRPFLMIIAVLIPMSIRCFTEEFLFLNLFGFDNYYDQVSWRSYFFDNFYYAIVYCSVGIVYYSVQYSQYKELQGQQIQIQQQKTELALLRSQINPHFLFNTLNNIYTLVYQKSDKALKAMDKLTNLLRYALYEVAEKVPLQKELEYISDFIDLESLRYNYPVQVDMQIEEAVKPLLVPPFSFIAFIENAFKHGNLKNIDCPLVIQFQIIEEHLFFHSQNAKKTRQKDQMGGIGLENVKKRLALIYDNQHDLKISETEDVFSVSLKIPLSLT